MDTFTTVPVPAGPDLVEEGAVDLVHLRAVDFGESFGHLNNLKL